LIVNDVMEWLRRVRDIALPTLPFSGVLKRLTALFKLIITGSLPNPRDPLPWTIDVADSWDNVIPGTSVSIDSIRIFVSDVNGPTSPPETPPRITRRRRLLTRKPRNTTSSLPPQKARRPRPRRQK
jgi:hypothetical protein